MSTVKLSSKGQLVIPKSLREAHHWDPGQELELVDTPDGVLLRARKRLGGVRLDQVAGCLAWNGTPKSVEDFEAAIRKGARESAGK